MKRFTQYMVLGLGLGLTFILYNYNASESKPSKPSQENHIESSFLTAAERARGSIVHDNYNQQQHVSAVSVQQLTKPDMRHLRRHFLTASDIVSLSATNRALHEHISQDVKQDDAYYENYLSKTVARVVQIFGGNTTEDKKEELIKHLKKHIKHRLFRRLPLLKWLHRLQRIHKMFFESFERFKEKITTLTRNKNEPCDKWLRRVEGIHRKLLEREVLTVLYKKTNGDDWRRKKNWNTDTDICKWYGVTCRIGRFRKLDLTNNDLSGSIPTEIGQLTNLDSLYLYSNKLSGPIPKEIGHLTNLELLVLGKNKLSGPTPREIGRLMKLEVLVLAENKLTSPIPKEIGQLKNLKQLYLSKNNLSGPIPLEIGQLSNLKTLELYNNNLTGPIPK